MLDVPPQAFDIIYGVMLHGKGAASVDGLQLEPVGTDVPSTQMVNPYTECYAGRLSEDEVLEAAAKAPTN